jgi:hypothetical protein|tara:strand:- start:1847 stop:2242 length:396 start_codon:yes stop_codon:yes gene_type:complete
MIPNIKISYKLKIIEVIEDGFRAISPDTSGLCIVRDNVSLKNHSFKKKDLVKINLELVETVSEDETHPMSFCVVVFQIASNGIYTKTFVDGENPLKSILFYQSRGMVTSKVLEQNPFEIGDLIKVTIEKCQ